MNVFRFVRFVVVKKITKEEAPPIHPFLRASVPAYVRPSVEGALCLYKAYCLQAKCLSVVRALTICRRR